MPYPMNDMDHSSRAFGWQLATMADLYHHVRQSSPGYADEIGTEALIAIAKVLQPETNPPWAQDFILSRENQRQFWPGAAWSNEAVWQVAVVAMAAMEWREITNNAVIDQLIEKCRSLIRRCWDPERGGFWENLRVYADGREPTLETWHDQGKLGTNHWVGAADTDAPFAEELWAWYRSQGGTPAWRDHERRVWEWSANQLADLPYVEAHP